MRMLVNFSINADIIDVPQSVIDNRKALQSCFFDWLYDTGNNHKYWRMLDGTMGVMYRSDAFVEWLNEFVLKDSTEKASILEQYVSRDNRNKLPTLNF